MGIGIPRPLQQAGERARLLLLQEHSEGKLGGEPPRELVLGAHRGLERIAAAVARRIEAVGGDEADVRQIEKHPKAQPLRPGVRRGERAEEHLEGVLVASRQVGAQRAGEMASALEDRERGEPRAGGAAKAGAIEPRVRERQVMREAVDGLGVEERGERAALGDRTRGGGEAGLQGRLGHGGGSWA